MLPAQNLQSIESQFQQAIADAGLITDTEIIADGQKHRLKVEGDKNVNTSAEYVLYGDGVPAGRFWSYKLPIDETWFLNNPNHFTQQERTDFAKRMAEVKKEKDKAQAIAHKEAREEAERLWSNARPELSEHKYLKDKEVQAYRIKSDGFKLLIPLRDTKGILHSIQTISPDGSKLFLTGGAKQRHYFGIGKPTDKLIIVEGYATGASIHHSTGHAIAVAFDAGNLFSVAIALREKFPDIEIIIASDNDQWTKGNPSVTKATEAASAVNGKLVIPEFNNTESKPTDFNDLARLEGLETVKEQIEKSNCLPEKNNSLIANLTCAGDVQPQPISWLWQGRIALGKLTIIAGDPGLGKSLLSVEFAKHVTQGISWPVDNTPCPVGDVILLSAEDDLADTIRPRLDATGANPNKVYFLDSIRDVDKDTGDIINRGFSLKRDISAIEQVLKQKPQTKLIVIDPISAYLGGTDSHNNADVRSLLSPLSEMASKRKVAIVAITHLNKGGGQGNAMYRATGSLAFVAAARAAFIVTKDNDDPDRRLFLPIKNNIGPDKTGFAYRVVEADNGAAMIEWEDEHVEITADDALFSITAEEKTERQEATEWLKKELEGGSVDSKEIYKSMDACGIAKRTLHRAKQELGVDVYKKDFAKGWAWRLPEDSPQDCQPCHSPVATFDENKADSYFQDAKDANNTQGCQPKQTGGIGNVGSG